MQDKETKLIKKLIDDKEFLTKFSENRSLEEQLGFLRANGFNFNEKEFKDFLKGLEEAYILNENLSEEDLERISGGKMQMKNKIAAAVLVFSAIGAGAMVGQASAWNWSDLLPHNLVRSAYNSVYTWMFPSDEAKESDRSKAEEQKNSEEKKAEKREKSDKKSSSRGKDEKKSRKGKKEKKLVEKAPRKKAEEEEKKKKEAEEAKKVEEAESGYEAREKFLERPIREYIGDISDPKPEHISDEDWKVVVEGAESDYEAQKEFLERQIRAHTNAINASKPKDLSDEEWDGIVEAEIIGLLERQTELDELNKLIEKQKKAEVPSHIGLANVGNTCYLNTALQILANESAKVNGGVNFKKAILNLSSEQMKGCETLSGLYNFFEAYDKGKDYIGETVMETIAKTLAEQGLAAAIGTQADTTETLEKIIDKCLEECDSNEELKSLKETIEGLFRFKYKEPVEFSEMAKSRGEIKEIKKGKWARESVDKSMYPSVYLAEDKAKDKTAEIAFREYFDEDLVDFTKATPKNLIIQFKRKQTEKGKSFNYEEVNAVTIGDFVKAICELKESSAKEILEKYKEYAVKEDLDTQFLISFYGLFPEGDEELSQKFKNKPDLKNLVCIYFKFRADEKMKKNIFENIIGKLISENREVVINETTYTKVKGKIKRKVSTNDDKKIENPIEILPEIMIQNKRYKLKSISIHSGGAVGGHYYAYIRDDVDTEVWRCYNDQSVGTKFVISGEEIGNTENLIKKDFIKKNAVNLTYELVE